MMDIQDPAQEFRHLASKPTPQVSESDDEEMVLNYSDSDESLPVVPSRPPSENEDLKEELDLLDKGKMFISSNLDVALRKYS